ncbi:hypothetical protein G9A89_009327 [Geosiphon pyriformis]|nr:hypothetical protein G9A89_009327 [Geosiphon pyriformis]
MGDYSYLPQQSKKHFKAHNKNDLDFIELNPLLSCLICFPIEKQSSRQFQDFWNWFLNEHSAETYTAYTTYYFDQPLDFEYLNHQIHIWIVAHQLTETLLETKEESYQTTPVFNLFSSESEHSTQTVTPEPMAQDPLQKNILIALQDIQTALGGNAQDPIKWLDDFERAATANQYNNEYKFQIIGGYLQGSSATWFSQETNANAQQRIIRWAPANAGEDNTSFTTWFEIKFRTSILISKWHMELERRTQGPGEIVTEYAKAIRKLIKQQKIHFFTKELRTDLSYALWPLLALKNNLTMDMAKLAQRIEDNQRMHLGFTLPVFAPAPVMAPALQMAATSFAVQTQDSNEQLIDRLTANLARLLEPLAQAVRDNQQLQKPRFESILISPNKPFIKDNKIMAHLYAIVTGWSNKLMDSKEEQYCMVMEINKEGITIREQIE